MSASEAGSVMDRYFTAMGKGEDFSEFFDENVTWLMVDNDHEVSGPEVVRDYINGIHSQMRSQKQREMVVTDGHAYLEGYAVNADSETTPGLAYCIVYDISGDRITAMRCYGTLAALDGPRR